MKTIVKQLFKLILLLIFGISGEILIAQEQLKINDLTSINTEEKKMFQKHEIGFSVGVFPVIGVIDQEDGSLFGNLFFKHKYQKKYEDRCEEIYHFGSYTFNYNYFYNLKHSLGGTLSWVGKHIDTYLSYPGTSLFGSSLSSAETVIGSGWKHYFTLQGNYRNTYYRKNDKIALYCGINLGINFGIGKNILHTKTIDLISKTESNSMTCSFPVMHLNLFGLEIGKKNVFHIELGIGTQGLIKTGYKYKF